MLKTTEKLSSLRRTTGVRGRQRPAMRTAKNNETSRTTKRSAKNQLTARTADRHALYQRAVQDPQYEIDFITKVYKKLRKRKPLKAREDFCGTAFFCAEWVKSDSKRTAHGVDFDKSVLDWGIKNNLKPMSEPGNRITLDRSDVRTSKAKSFDVVTAYNYSYWIFQTRPEMLKYFRNARAALKRDGIFFLDAYGGLEGPEVMKESRRVPGGFSYVWDQNTFNPITNTAQNYIHFKFRDGTKLDKAFAYEWRVWSLIETQELLKEAGFSKVDVYWEDEDKDGDGNGNYRARKKADNDLCWLAYVVAQK